MSTPVIRGLWEHLCKLSWQSLELIYQMREVKPSPAMQRVLDGLELTTDILDVAKIVPAVIDMHKICIRLNTIDDIVSLERRIHEVAMDSFRLISASLNMAYLGARAYAHYWKMAKPLPYVGLILTAIDVAIQTLEAPIHWHNFMSADKVKDITAYRYHLCSFVQAISAVAIAALAMSASPVAGFTAGFVALGSTGLGLVKDYYDERGGVAVFDVPRNFP
jgi:hypothetical protein